MAKRAQKPACSVVVLTDRQDDDLVHRRHAAHQRCRLGVNQGREMGRGIAGAQRFHGGKREQRIADGQQRQQEDARPSPICPSMVET